MKNGWPEVTLEEVCSFERGASPTLKTEAGQYPMVVTASYRRSSPDYQFDKPAVCIPLISSTGHGNAAIHRIHYQDGKFALANLLVAAIPRNDARLDAKFLWRYLSAMKDKKLVPLMQGTANVGLKEHDLQTVTIPLPPMAEQQRIVAHLDAIEERLTCVLKLRKGVHLEIEALTTSLHLSLARDRRTKMDQLLFLDEEQAVIVSGGSYPQVGIRSFGMGLFAKPAITGSKTTYRAFNVLRPGKFVMSQVKGWEGAVGVVDDNFDGWFVSPEYRTFSCINSECDPSYLSFLITTKWFRTQLSSATRGVGARRERVRPEKVLALEMPFPVIEKQRSAAKLLKSLDAGKHLSARCSTLEAALIPSILDRVFNG